MACSTSVYGLAVRFFPAQLLILFIAENQQLREQLATTNQQSAIAMEEEEVPTAPALHEQYIQQELEGNTYTAFSMRALIHQ